MSVISKKDAYLYAGELTKDSYNSCIRSLVCENPSEGMVEEIQEGDEGSPREKIAGKISVKLIERVEEKMSKIKTIEIAESKGDIKKLRYNDEFNSVAKLVESVDSNSKYTKIYLNNYEFLQSNRRKFKKAFKDSDKNLLSMFYIANVLYHVEMTAIMTTALYKKVHEGQDIDETIEDTKEFEKVFLKIEDMISDDDLKKFMNIDFSKDLIGESRVSVDMIEYYSETSINDTLRLFKLGLAAFLHKLTSFIRFIIYIFFYVKFSLENKIQKINTTIESFQADQAGEREQLTREAKELNKEHKIASIEGQNEAEKQKEKEKIEIEDESGFSL